MEIYLLRHGEAEPREGAFAEASRALTNKGRRDVRRIVKRALSAGFHPSAIVSSPYVRAWQTAEIAAELFGLPIEESRDLLPDADPSRVWHALAPEIPSVLLVGHEPHLGRLAQFLLQHPVAIDFKKGALLRIDTDAPPDEPHGNLKWLLIPRLAR